MDGWLKLVNDCQRARMASPPDLTPRPPPPPGRFGNQVKCPGQGGDCTLGGNMEEWLELL